MAEFAFVQLGTELHEQPDAASNVISSYKAGTWVEIEAADGAVGSADVEGAPAPDVDFLNVTGPDGMTGFVPATNLFILSQTPAQDVAVVANNGKYVNLRQEASKKATILAKVNSGTPMTLIETGKKFDHVRIGGIEGYMAAGMLKVGMRPISTLEVKTGNGKNVNMRSEPTLNGDVLTTVPNGAQVSVMISGGGWSYVRYRQTDGYIMSKFLTHKAPDPTPKPDPDPEKGFWDVGLTCFVSNGGASVRYRSGPGKDYPVLGSYSSGTEIFVYSTNGTWSKISRGYGGKMVYMMSKYIVTINPGDDDDYEPIYEDEPYQTGDFSFDEYDYR